MNFPNFTMQNVRRNCLECTGDNRAAVRFCPCHGRDGSRCEFWPYRFGKNPASAAKQLGPAANILLDPERMPPNSVPLEDCEAWLQSQLTNGLPASVPAIAATDA